MIRRLLTLTAAGALLTACGTLTTPVAQSSVVIRTTETALGSFLGAGSGGTASAAAVDEWWGLFEDPQLDALIGRALAANTDLRVAFANLETARAAARESGGARLPATVVESGAGPQRADRQPGTSSVPSTGYELGATLAFEIDLFGRLRQAALAAEADADAVAAARDAVAVTVAADTAAAYLDLCGANAGLALSRDLLAAQTRAYALVEEQLRAGEVSPLEVSQAAVLRDQTAATLPVFEADRRRALFRLATLQGLTPGEGARLDIRCERLPQIATPLPVGDGAALLARRPDVREAERRLSAAAARLGVARADLYPRIQLGGSAGLLAGGADAFLTPLITWAFPNQIGPRVRIQGAQGGQAAALATFDGVVLRALEEVETALSDYEARSRRRDVLKTAAQAADDVVRRARVRQRLGADDFLLVIDAERTRNAAAVQALNADLEVARSQLALFRALGGGWRTVAAGDAADGR